MKKPTEKMVSVLFKCPVSLKELAETTAREQDSDLSKFIRRAMIRALENTAPATNTNPQS